MVSLKKAMEKLKKNYGAATIFEGSENVSIECETLSSGCLAFDYALGVGGLPIGRLIEVSGIEGSGKTAFCASTIGEWQSKGKRCAFIDAEHAATKDWFEKLGVNFEELIFARPEFLEDALDMIDTLASSGEVDLIVWDSVPALPSRKEGESAAGTFQVASVSKVLSPGLRKLSPIFAKNKCTGIFINQIREKISTTGIQMGDPETTPGGRALKHYCSLRLKMGKVSRSQITSGDQKTGHRVSIRSLKNKLSSAQGIKSEFVLMYDSGVDKVQDALETAIQTGIIQRPNSKSYQFEDLKVTGRDNMINSLRDDSNLMQKVIDAVYQKLQPKDTVKQEDPELSDSHLTLTSDSPEESDNFSIDFE